MKICAKKPIKVVVKVDVGNILLAHLEPPRVIA